MLNRGSHFRKKYFLPWVLCFILEVVVLYTTSFTHGNFTAQLVFCVCVCVCVCVRNI